MGIIGYSLEHDLYLDVGICQNDELPLKGITCDGIYILDAGSTRKYWLDFTTEFIFNLKVNFNTKISELSCPQTGN
jgi:hypothetical protein